ncbi:MAG TPA: carboxypeptidase-like regulatory domain-containing protein, partial [Bryobacteraceae bacterium]
MNFKSLSCAMLALTLCGASLLGQTVASSIVGTVVDPADAVVSGAPVTLTNVGTSAVRTGTTDNTGTYRFQNIEPGTYNVDVRAAGFKAETQTGIVVVADETHNAGRMVLALGSLSESISVTAEAAQVQLASSEKSQTVDSANLEDLTLKGRDLFGYMRLVPGVIDSTASRDVTSHTAVSGFTINGNSLAVNFTVDGVTDLDTGSNTSNHYEPNMDSIQELKVLTSNYQAEFGRNSGGTITVVTKSGTQQFHGSGAWNHRHEEFNADSWGNNHTVVNGAATPRPDYRYNVETYSLGGPAYIPKIANKDKKRLFFFVSQEYTGQYVSPGSSSFNAPTAAERLGNFSDAYTNAGVQVKVLDPASNNAQFSGNVVPASRINAVGQQLLNFFPLPNYTPTLPSQLNVVNYFEEQSATHPRRNDVLRFDANITSKLSGYFRWINDFDHMVILYSGVDFSSDTGGVLGSKGISPIDHPNSGHGYSGTATYTITPTLINEVTISESWDTYSFYTLDNQASEQRSLESGLPSLFPVPGPSQNPPGVLPVNGYQTILPSFSFSGTGATTNASYSRNSSTAGAYANANPIWSYQDNVSKIVGHHAFKAGVYIENNDKFQPSGKNYLGSFSFGASSTTPLLNTNDGYVNAELGNVSSYSQSNGTSTFDFHYWNVDFYVQDNWKVNRRLTLDIGMRFVHQTPQTDANHTIVNFVPQNYSPGAMPRIYVPYCSNGAATCNSGNTLVARDPGTGALAGSGFIGDFVPNTGNPNAGMTVMGINNVPADPYHQPFLAYAPRLGFSYDVFGDGKTAVRGGWGMFYNRLDGNQVYGMTAQAPLFYTQSVNGGLTFAQIAAQNTGAPPALSSLIVAPSSPTIWPYNGDVPFDTVMNASVDVQRTVNKSTVVDIGYTTNYAYNLHTSYNQNWIPIGTGWPFTPSNINPTTAGSTSTGLSSIFLETKYPGYGSMSEAVFSGRTNYNSLTASVNKRLSHGIQWGLAYAFSKALGNTTYSPAAAALGPNYNYGRTGQDRRNNLTVNYNYDIPGLGKALGFRPLGVITDHWEYSGIATFQSGAPYNPGCGLTSG